MGFVAGSGEATIVGVTALDNGSTQIDISIRGTIPNGITELLEHGVSENLINNWLGFDYRLGLPGGGGGEVSITYNPAEHAATGSLAVSGSIFGGEISGTMRFEDGRPVFQEISVFGGLQAIYGEQFEAFGIVRGASGKAQLGVFLELDENLLLDASVGATFAHSIGLGVAAVEFSGSTEIVGVSDLSLSDLVALVTEIYEADGFSSSAASIAATNFARNYFPKDQVNDFLVDTLGLGDQCFGSETPIDMWPLDLSLKPGPDGIYDQGEVRAKIWKKPIELIEVGDIVVSFDENDNLVPGPVTRTFKNEAKILLDFHGTRVTPGHVYYQPDSRKPDKFETLIDVLRDDGVIQHQDGTLIRAATNVPVGDPRDGFVKAITGIRKTDGTLEQKDEGRIRLGTRFLVGEGKTRKAWSVADLIKAGGGVVGDDELIRVGDGPAMPFFWEFGDTLPDPEDFVLACSDTTLEDIYKAAEWESQGPRLPAPMVLDRGQVKPLKGNALSAMPRNEPLDVTHAPVATQKPQRTLNRKQRKAMEVKQRKAIKARKRVVG